MCVCFSFSFCFVLFFYFSLKTPSLEVRFVRSYADTCSLVIRCPAAVGSAVVAKSHFKPKVHVSLE